MCYFDVTPPKIRELIGVPNAGRLVHRLVHNFRASYDILLFSFFDRAGQITSTGATDHATSATN